MAHTLDIAYKVLVVGEEEEGNGSQSSNEESSSGEEDDTPLNEDDYFQTPPTIQSTNISFTDMNLSRPLLKVLLHI